MKPIHNFTQIINLVVDNLAPECSRLQQMMIYYHKFMASSVSKISSKCSQVSNTWT